MLLTDLPMSFLETTFVVHLVALGTERKKSIGTKLATDLSFSVSLPLLSYPSPKFVYT